MKKSLAIANFVSVIAVLLVNGLSQSQRWNNTTIGEMSAKYDNLFTPAGYAFAIWGLIFLLLSAYGLFQMYRVFFSKKESLYIEQTGGWFVTANIFNCLWVVAFTYDYVWASLLIMLGILISLLQIILKTNMQRKPLSLLEKLLVTLPISIYAGWITVATIANFSAFFASINLMGSKLTQIVWTIVLITIAVLVNTLVVWLRHMRAFAGVAIWALVAIFFRHQDSINSIAYYALVSAMTLCIIIVLYSYSKYKEKQT